jgi:hypothetical protein
VSEALRDKVEAHLLESGNWEDVGSPYLRWLDLRARAAGDGRAVDIGTAVLREMDYEGRGV